MQRAKENKVNLKALIESKEASQFRRALRSRCCALRLPPWKPAFEHLSGGEVVVSRFVVLLLNKPT